MTGSTFRQQWRDDLRDSDDPAIDLYTMAVAWALDRHMSAYGRTTTGRRRLAQLARVGSAHTVQTRLERLIALGWLIRDWAGRGSRASYRVAYPVHHFRHEEWCTQVNHSACACAGKVVHPTAESGAPGDQKWRAQSAPDPVLLTRRHNPVPPLSLDPPVR